MIFLINYASILCKISDFNNKRKRVKKVRYQEDAFEIVDKEIKTALQNTLSELIRTKDIKVSFITLSDIVGEPTSLTFWRENIFSVAQCVEIWNAVGGWIEAYQFEMGPRIKEAMNYFKTFDRTALNEALRLRAQMFYRVCEFTKATDLF